MSYTVGCAFNVCMELRLAKEKLTDVSKEDSFTRSGSFRKTTMVERRTDPQSAMIAGELTNFQTSGMFSKLIGFVIHL